MYSVELSRQAQKYYASVDVATARRLAQAFETLEENPRPPGCAALHGELEGKWRLRVGSFRMIYEVHDAERRVRVVKIGPRGDAYK